MFKSIRARILLILLVVGTSGWYLYQNQQESGSPVKLGLDLLGGMHLVLEIDDPEGTLSLEDRSDAIDRSETVLRNRVDELGVEEPLIQKVGQDRLIVELAGVTDEARAKEIIGTTALLEFKLVRPLSDIDPYLARIDRAIVATLGADSLRALGRDATAPESAVEDLLFGAGPTRQRPMTSAQDTAGDTAQAAADTADRAGPRRSGRRSLRGGAAPSPLHLAPPLGRRGDLPGGHRGLPGGPHAAGPPRGAGGPAPHGAHRGPRPQLGDGSPPRSAAGPTASSTCSPATPSWRVTSWKRPRPLRDAQFNMPIVQFGLSRAGGRDFGTATRQNVGERIAIVLDGDVVSAPGGPLARSGSGDRSS
jgi:hypothetical protein